MKLSLMTYPSLVARPTKRRRYERRAELDARRDMLRTELERIEREIARQEEVDSWT